MAGRIPGHGSRTADDGSHDHLVISVGSRFDVAASRPLYLASRRSDAVHERRRMSLAVAQPRCKISRLVSHIAQREIQPQGAEFQRGRRFLDCHHSFNYRVTHHENPSRRPVQIQLSRTWPPSRRPNPICRRTNGPRYGFDWQEPARHLRHIPRRERAGAVRPARGRLSRC